MSDFRNVVVVGNHKVIHRPKGVEEAKVAADGVFKMSKEDFDTFGPKGRGAVRPATREDHEAAGNQFNGAPEDLFDHDQVAGPGGSVVQPKTAKS